MSTAELRRQERLKRLWHRQDQLHARLRHLQSEINQLQRDVGCDSGFVFPPSREVLERTLGGK